MQANAYRCGECEKITSKIESNRCECGQLLHLISREDEPKLVDQFKGKRRWQNLVFKKCPNCNNELDRFPAGYGCSQCNFFITLQKMTTFLTDADGACYLNMNQNERAQINTTLQEMESE